MYYKDRRGFTGLVGLLIAAVIMAIIFFLMMKIYVGKPSKRRYLIDKERDTNLGESGIDTSSPKGVLESTRDKIDSIKKTADERYKGLY